MTSIAPPTMIYIIVILISYVILKKRESHNRVAYSQRQQLAFFAVVFIIGIILGEVLYNVLVGAGWIIESIAIINVSKTLFVNAYIPILIGILFSIVAWGKKNTEEKTKSPVDHAKSCGYVSMRINPDDWYNKELEMVRRFIQEEILDWGSVDGLTVPLKRLKKRLDIPEKLKDMIIKKFIERSKGKFQAPFFEIKSDIVDMRFDNEKDALVFDLPS